jgi:acetoin utilization deacetylase AcuC-like enzyme
MSLKTGIVRDDRYLRHETSHFHPESPKRLESIYDMLDAPDMEGNFVEVEPRFAERGEIELIHRHSYIEMVARTAGKNHVYLDADTETSPESYEIAKLAVGGYLNVVDRVMTGEIGNAFAFVRPPGHHAEADRAAGFCIFNNIAIGAMHAIKNRGAKRVLIVDWDLHHGNGTQHSFYEDPRVLYFSTHQSPFYPGTGGISEIGKGEGKGFTINVPLRRGPGNAEYLRIFRKILLPVALEYSPDVVMLSAGFDIYYEDPLGGMKVTPEGFGCLTRVLMDIADACCGGKFAVTLEGGYNISGQTRSAKVVLKEMAGYTRLEEEDLNRLEKEADPSIDGIIRNVINEIGPYWPVLQ